MNLPVWLDVSFAFASSYNQTGGTNANNDNRPIKGNTF